MLKDLEHYICEKVISANNAQKFYIEGVRFKNHSFVKLCEQKILENFDALCKEGVLQIPQILRDIPFKVLKSLLQNDGLRVSNEKFVVDLVESYLKHREALPLLPEEDPKNDWSLLTDEERAKRTEVQNKQKEEEKK